ncbi:XrtA-associated tyrosine autokinase [Geoalkalibacter subterraneus]|uniref:CobQ/CobB/MinD/ParA nucleotide binding domain-containing protein n=1 Tax=Geoalkalibacter subterraneus TaxID=483547 RepID=A0A0B5FEA8_9BACT|nr:XrtA-associated tyrosine autokinase [Geoalkalibacter subterraneus]AJF06487.1 hypothetical protein GSUB_07920 [Geoalkalibacter subterraneus]
MSRIEKALEKAAKQRESSDQKKDHKVREIPTLRKEAPGKDFSAFDAVPHPQIQNPYLVTANDRHSPISEQYRKLKSLLVKTAKGQDGRNSLLITSTVGGEGKTITALNLGIALAQEYDHTVLLIEADLRRPSIMSYLGLEGGVGLTDCVLDGIDVGSALVKTGIGKLVVLSAGRPVEDPVEVFSSSRMAAILEEVKKRYSDRFVIVDSTPLLPFAEGYILANLVDYVMFVARQDYTPFDKLKEALASLKSNNLLGVVCNDVDSTLVGNGYYGYYGYYNYAKKA